MIILMKVQYFAEKSARLKTLTSHSYNFVMKVHHRNQDKFFCNVIGPTQKNRCCQHCPIKVTLHR